MKPYRVQRHRLVTRAMRGVRRVGARITELGMQARMQVSYRHLLGIPLSLLWEHGRPVIYLSALCLSAGLLLSPVSGELTLVFITAAVGAFSICLWMLRPLATATPANAQVRALRPMPAQETTSSY